ncbi:MAG: DNA mismatch endonuclease Vsr [Bacillota bacterium]|nr:DNA mismatch endonuclease Vsr [Bacillota bacterium]
MDNQAKEYTPRDPKIVSFTMSHIRYKDTGIELKLRRELHRRGYHYRCNDKRVFGHPDIVFPKWRLVIFCDSEFWHGYNFEKAQENIKSNRDFWLTKIQRNIARDKTVNEKLKSEGYIVLRFWSFQINKDFDYAMETIEKAISDCKKFDEITGNGLIKTTLCYLEKDDCYLMLYRNRKKDDLNQGKWIGVGGHLEDGETPYQCAKREIFEETSLTINKMRYRGYIDFLNDAYPGERMYLYTSNDFSGELSDCDESELKWIKKEEISSLNLWDGDRLFLPLLTSEKKTFSMTLFYHGDELARHIGPIYKEAKKHGRRKR